MVTHAVGVAACYQNPEQNHLNGQKIMTDIRKLFILAIIFGLISCGDNNTQPVTQAQQTPAPGPGANDPSQAIEHLNAILAENPNDFNALSTLGDLYFQTSQYMEAIQVYDRAIAVNPSSADCMNDKGLALFYTGDLESALESFEQANATDPEYVNAWLSRGYVLFASGRYQEAIEPLNKVKELDTTGTMSWEADKFLSQIAAAGTQ